MQATAKEKCITNYLRTLSNWGVSKPHGNSATEIVLMHETNLPKETAYESLKTREDFLELLYDRMKNNRKSKNAETGGNKAKKRKTDNSNQI